MNFLNLIWLIPLFPAIGFVINGLIGKRLPKTVIGVIAAGAVLLSFIFSAGAVFQLLQHGPEDRSHTVTLYQWINAGDVRTSEGPLARFTVDWAFLLDPLSAVMVLVVTGVGFLIHIYSTGYMHDEDGFYRFFAYLNLFMFSMLTLVLGNNYLMMFIGWEGVGLCSYLLIGYYFHKRSAGDAAKKAFVVNRVGDWGLSIGIMLIFVTFGSIDFQTVGEKIKDGVMTGAFHVSDPIFIVIALALFVGATGKSAQIPLYVWLPDAMEGPTPVSALIHAATMVTAGVYMVARSNFIYQMAPQAMTVVAVIGALTAFFAASIGLVQNDIKRVLAYSTVSQLGYMFLALGVGAFAAGIFHLMTHAFFKALLFLGAGSVIHALSGEQDLRKMGGLWNSIPATSRPFLIATLAIAGMPPLAGFFSKDEILGRTIARSAMLDRYLALWIIGVFTAGLTAFYMFRLLNLTFFGRSRIPHEVEHHIHESPKSMTIPLAILALLSIIGGWVALPALWGAESPFEKFLEPVLSGVIPETGAIQFAHHPLIIEYLLMSVSVAVAGFGIWLAYRLYLKFPHLHSKVAASWPRLHKLLNNKYYVDELYDAIFVNRIKDLSTAFALFDTRVIDGLGVDGSASLTRILSRISMWGDKWVVDGLVNFVGKFTQLLSHPVRMFQTGLFSSYAMWILIGLAILLGYYSRHMEVLVRHLR